MIDKPHVTTLRFHPRQDDPPMSPEERILRLAKKYTTTGVGIPGRFSELLKDCHDISKAYLELLEKQVKPIELVENKHGYTIETTYKEIPQDIPSFLCDEKLGSRCKTQCDVCAIAEGVKKL